MSETAPDNAIPKPLDLNLMGDSAYPISYLYNNPIENPTNDFKISYTGSTMDSQIRKLRISLEDYKELLIQVNSVLLWEKHWHPYGIVGGCTVIFMLMWLSQPNVLTILSMLGLFVTVADYVLPGLVTSVFKNDDWTFEKQKQYEEICTNIVLHKTKLELLLASYYRLRVTNPKVYFTITISALSVLAWIGSAVNNLFLMYVAVLIAACLPGMANNGMLNKASDALSKIFTGLVENAKSKVGQKKVQ